MFEPTNNKYDLKTFIIQDIIIKQELYGTCSITDKVERLTTWICDTRDKTIKDALIEMGWTPPPIKICYYEPNESCGNCKVVISKERAIYLAKKSASVKGHTYDNDEQALADFKVIHGAWEE